MKFVSTVAFNNDFETYLNYFEDSDIGVEFSSGGTISGQKNIDYFRNFGGKKDEIYAQFSDNLSAYRLWRRTNDNR